MMFMLLMSIVLFAGGSFFDWFPLRGLTSDNFAELSWWEKIIDYFCSDKVANDKAIFIDPEDESAKGLFEKDSEKTCFVKTDDAWYEPIRKLGGTA